MNQITKRDMIEKGLDVLDTDRIGGALTSYNAGGVSFATATEVIEFAKLMAVADKAVPKFLRGNPGACLRITFQAIEWRMSPWAVADKTYEVNDRLAYESQLIHAVIEARAPLQHRLAADYEGEIEKGTRKCIITGMFTNGDERTYESPEIGKIKVTNSPLWTGDPDQQLFYFASRAWARRWCPDVLMGIYTREELQADPKLGAREDDDVSPGLHGRLVESGAAGHGEGFNPDKAQRELDQVASGAPAEVKDADPPKDNDDGKKASTKKKDAAKGKAAAKDEEDDPKQPPKTARQYADRWRKLVETLSYDDAAARWDAEREMRDELSVPIATRTELEKLIEERKPQ